MKLSRLFIVLLLLTVVTGIFAQVSGDYRSKASGNWSAVGTWQTYDGSSWSDASAKPDSDNNVYVQSGHTVTLTANEACDDLHIAKGTSSTNNTYGRVALATYSLENYGKLRTYYAAVNTVPGTSTDAMPNLLISCTSSSGKLVVKGSSRTWTTSGEWHERSSSSTNTGFYTGSTSSFNLEIDPGSGVTITMETGMRPQSWNIVSGTLDVTDNPMEVDNGTTNQGDVTIGANATVASDLPVGTNGIAVFRRLDSTAGGTFTLNGKLLVTGARTNLNMNNPIMNGVVEYNRAGDQYFLRAYAGSDPATYTNIVLSGSGVKSLIISTTINGKFTIGGTATLSLNSRTLTYGSSATLEYKGTSAQTTNAAEWPTGGPKNVIIDNSNGVTFGSTMEDISVPYNLTLTSGTLDLDGFMLTINGITYHGAGSWTGGTFYTDGYSAVSNRFIEIAESGNNIGSLDVTMSQPSLLPAYADRQWVIDGSYTGNKSVTFYWTDTDDDNFDWTSKAPAVWEGTTKYSATSYNVSGATNYVTVSIPSTFGGGTYVIGQEDGSGTLPIELSSFTVAMNAYNLVTLQWVTQSETNLSGFRVYRNVVENLNGASMLNLFVPATNTSQTQVYMVTDEEVQEDGLYYYWLENLELDGTTQLHGPTSINVTFSNPETPEVPLVQGIASAYPNPFNPSVTVACGLKIGGHATVQVFNQRGQLVKELFDGSKDAGTFNLQWNGTDNNGKKVPSGVYYILMDANGDKSSRKVVLSK